MVIDIAENKKIPFQREAASRVTGTDTDAFAYACGGIPSVLVSLPLRYMHTTVEAVDIDDVQNVIKLIYETLLQLKPNYNFRYL
jgi:endoglucanase